VEIRKIKVQGQPWQEVREMQKVSETPISINKLCVVVIVIPVT
jgi:hypothetical protein